jgi:CheY-like chemotaxis protein
MIFLKKKQVLIVDDEVDLREMLALELKNYQTAVFEAKNGLEAFELIKKENIDLVISDIRMPGGNGIEFLKKTKALNIKSPQFVFITAYSDITIEELFALGAAGIVEKPFDIPELFNLLNWLAMPLPERYALIPKTKPTINFKFNQNENSKNRFALGRGGALIPTESTVYEVGSLISFEIILSSYIKISGIGEINWNNCMNSANNYYAGMSFKYFDDSSRKDAIELLTKLNCIEIIPKASAS